MTEFFKSEKISPSTTRIFTLTGEVVYLVEGENKAILLDAGLGLGDLDAYIKTITAKPVELFLTHGHMDHAGGASSFKKAYLHPSDYDLARMHNQLAGKKQYAAMWLQGTIPPDEDFVSCREPLWIPLHDGDTFELGGITLTAYALPGHTAGIMTVLIREERALLLGDACNLLTFLFDENTLTVQAYHDALVKFKAAQDGKFDTVYLSHGGGDVPKAVVDGVIQVCDDILTGSADDAPFEFMGSVYCLAKKADPRTMRRDDGGIGNIVYNKSRIR